MKLGLLYNFITVYLSVKYLVAKQHEISSNNIGIPPLSTKAVAIRAKASAYRLGNLKIGAVQINLASFYVKALFNLKFLNFFQTQGKNSKNIYGIKIWRQKKPKYFPPVSE